MRKEAFINIFKRSPKKEIKDGDPLLFVHQLKESDIVGLEDDNYQYLAFNLMNEIGFYQYNKAETVETVHGVSDELLVSMTATSSIVSMYHLYVAMNKIEQMVEDKKSFIVFNSGISAVCKATVNITIDDILDMMKSSKEGDNKNLQDVESIPELTPWDKNHLSKLCEYLHNTGIDICMRVYTLGEPYIFNTLSSEQVKIVLECMCADIT